MSRETLRRRPAGGKEATWQPALFPLRRNVETGVARLQKMSCSSQRPELSSETEKRRGDLSADHSSIRASRATAFRGRARGDRVQTGPWTVVLGHRLRGSSPSTLNRSGQSQANDRSPRNCRRIVRYGYVVLFSSLGSNSFPFFHTVKATAAILRARVSRAISARMPPCLSFSTYGL